MKIEKKTTVTLSDNEIRAINVMIELTSEISDNDFCSKSDYPCNCCPLNVFCGNNVTPDEVKREIEKFLNNEDWR